LKVVQIGRASRARLVLDLAGEQSLSSGVGLE
jgi:hypothetical protein